MTGIGNGIALFIVFLLSTCLHEAAHAWAAHKGGDPTAHDAGLVTIDPVPHVKRSPVGMLLLPLITVVTMGWPLGYASSPYDPWWAERHPERAAWMSLAGPAANLGLALGAGLLINVGLFAGVFQAPESIGFADVTVAAAGQGQIWQVAAWVLGAVFALNLLLMLFNLLPFPPLDGSDALVLLLPERAVPAYRGFVGSSPYFSLIGIFIAWQAFDYVFDPVFTQTLNLLYLLHGVSYS